MKDNMDFQDDKGFLYSQKKNNIELKYLPKGVIDMCE